MKVFYKLINQVQSKILTQESKSIIDSRDRVIHLAIAIKEAKNEISIKDYSVNDKQRLTSRLNGQKTVDSCSCLTKL